MPRDKTDSRPITACLNCPAPLNWYEDHCSKDCRFFLPFDPDNVYLIGKRVEGIDIPFDARTVSTSPTGGPGGILFVDGP